MLCIYSVLSLAQCIDCCLSQVSVPLTIVLSNYFVLPLFPLFVLIFLAISVQSGLSATEMYRKYMQGGLYVYTLWKNKSLAVSSRDAKNGETRASWRRQLNRFFAPLPSLEKEGRKEGGCPISPGVFKKLLALLFTVEVVALPPRYTTEILMLHTSYSVRIRRRREEKEFLARIFSSGPPSFLLVTQP